VLGAPPGEGHAFALALIADVLRLRNLAVLELGVQAPAAAFVDAATNADRLVAVGIGVTSIDNLDAAAEVIASVHAVHPSVPAVLGGRAVGNPEIAQLSGATAWSSDAIGFADLIDSLVQSAKRAAHRH
jgi:hypothetical protein